MLVWSEVSALRRSPSFWWRSETNLQPAASRAELSDRGYLLLLFRIKTRLRICFYFIFSPATTHPQLPRPHTPFPLWISDSVGRLDAHSESTQAKPSDFSPAQLLSRVFICLLTPLHRVRQATVAPFQQQQLPGSSVCGCVCAHAGMYGCSLAGVVRSEPERVEGFVYCAESHTYTH